MKLSIIPSDATVCKGGICHAGLVWVGTPPDVHALQWNGTRGEVEYNDGKPNEVISTLPNWALNAEAAWVVANTPAPVTPPTRDEVVSTQSHGINQLINDEAVSRGFDSIAEIALYTGYPNPLRVSAEALGKWAADVKVMSRTEHQNWRDGGAAVDYNALVALLPTKPV